LAVANTGLLLAYCPKPGYGKAISPKGWAAPLFMAFTGQGYTSTDHKQNQVNLWPKSRKEAEKRLGVGEFLNLDVDR
jgi:hypothetical protein